jgi:hypothetical protein
MHRIHRLKLGGGSLIMPHIGHGGIVYAGANAAYGLLRLPHRACLRYIHLLRRLEHLFHLKTSVMGASLAGW